MTALYERGTTMHLDDDRLINLLRDDADDADGHRHVAGCASCRTALELWRHRLEGLRALTAESVDDRELHRLRTLFRHRGPQSEATAGRWLARLVRSSVEPVPAFRGAAEARLLELEGGPLRVVLQLAGSTLHGQVTSDADDVGAGTLVLSADDGTGYTTELDDLGEFHLERLRPGRYHASWWTSAGRLETSDLEIGDPSGA